MRTRTLRVEVRYQQNWYRWRVYEVDEQHTGLGEAQKTWAEGVSVSPAGAWMAASAAVSSDLPESGAVDPDAPASGRSAMVASEMPLPPGVCDNCSSDPGTGGWKLLRRHDSGLDVWECPFCGSETKLKSWEARIGETS